MAGPSRFGRQVGRLRYRLIREKLRQSVGEIGDANDSNKRTADEGRCSSAGSVVVAGGETIVLMHHVGGREVGEARQFRLERHGSWLVPDCAKRPEGHLANPAGLQ